MATVIETLLQTALQTSALQPMFHPLPETGKRQGAPKAHRKENVSGPSFSGLFARAQEAHTESCAPVPALPVSEETVQVLMDAVHTAGDALKHRPLPEEIRQYKQAVRNFIHYVVENSFDTEKQFIGINKFRRKEKTMIRVVDQKLEQLAAGILSGQTAQLELLGRLEEIQGLLVDITIQNGIHTHA